MKIELISEKTLLKILFCKYIKLLSVKTCILACTFYMEVFWLVNINKFICWRQTD